MVNPNKIPKVACHMEFPYGMVNSDTILTLDILKYGRREFQINGVLIDVD